MSLPRYPSYKEANIGWLRSLPEHWEIAPLKRMLDIQNGADHKAVETDHGFPVIGSGGPFAFASTPMFDGESVLLGRKGTIDKPLYVRGPFWTVDTMYWSKIEEGTSARFAYYVATTIPFGYYSTNTALPSMTKSLLNAHLVPLPHLSEQQVIAAFLDRETAKIDALIAEQEKLIALLAEKRQATIAHAVTRGLEPDVPMKDSGAPCIGEVPAHWEVAPLKRFWSVTDCKHLTAEFVDDGYPLASIREVQSRYVALEEAKRTTEHFYAQLIEGDRKPMPGDLIFSRNATVGEVSQVTEEHPAFAMGQDVCLLRRLDASASPDYLQDVIRSGVVVEQLKNIMVGSTFKRVNVEEIRCLAVPMPPTGEQRRIAEFLKAERMRFEAIEQHAGRSISLLRERRSALITAAVTGQIDVRGTAQHDRTTPESIAA